MAKTIKFTVDELNQALNDVKVAEAKAPVVEPEPEVPAPKVKKQPKTKKAAKKVPAKKTPAKKTAKPTKKATVKKPVAKKAVKKAPAKKVAPKKTAKKAAVKAAAPKKTRQRGALKMPKPPKRDLKFYGALVSHKGSVITKNGYELLFKASRTDGRWIQVSLSGDNDVHIEMEGEWNVSSKN